MTIYISNVKDKYLFRFTKSFSKFKGQKEIQYNTFKD